MPLNLRFHVYSLYNDSRCYFCKWGPENELHLFGNCEKLSPLWELLDEAVIFALNTPYSFSINRKEKGDIDLVNTRFNRELEIPLSYLNSIVNHKIYKLRNEIKYEGAVFSLNILFSKIIRTVCSSRAIERRLPELQKIPKLNNLYQGLQMSKHLLDQIEIR